MILDPLTLKSILSFSGSSFLPLAPLALPAHEALVVLKECGQFESGGTIPVEVNLNIFKVLLAIPNSSGFGSLTHGKLSAGMEFEIWSYSYTSKCTSMTLFTSGTYRDKS